MYVPKSEILRILLGETVELFKSSLAWEGAIKNSNCVFIVHKIKFTR